jgi:7,8-dihydropterin-6-yl-methyl-4-(beta-D-ribofuranosyl)aminobenzene 5'-phosphate synthase
VLLESTDVVTRPPRAKEGEISLNTLLAEHGLSLLLKVWLGQERHAVLFDTGYTGIALFHNAELLGIDLAEIEALILSHAHMDHTGALKVFLDRIGRSVPVVLHPEAFHYPRFLVLKDGRKEQFPRTLTKADLQRRNLEILESKAPLLVAGDAVLVSGEVERRTDFEKGIPHAYMEKDGQVVKDNYLDDQALVLHLKGKGLVVISGCSHSGIVNTVLHARKTAGVERVHAVLGGFHLSGPAYEPILEDTIKALKQIDPKVLVPMHCTGWNTINLLAKTFPSSTILNSVGSKFTLS